MNYELLKDSFGPPDSSMSLNGGTFNGVPGVAIPMGLKSLEHSERWSLFGMWIGSSVSSVDLSNLSYHLQVSNCFLFKIFPGTSFITLGLSSSLDMGSRILERRPHILFTGKLSRQPDVGWSSYPDALDVCNIYLAVLIAFSALSLLFAK